MPPRGRALQRVNALIIPIIVRVVCHSGYGVLSIEAGEFTYANAGTPARLDKQAGQNA